MENRGSSGKTSQYILQTHLMSKAYKNGFALSSVSLNVPQHSIYGLVGKNGSGKTTLMRILCGLQEPTGGSYSINGVSSLDQKIHLARNHIGAVIEKPAIYPDMTAEQNLMQQLLLLGCPDTGQIRDILSLVGLEYTSGKKAKDYSLGMRQRLGIGIAIAGNPDLLILDEPANGLDPQGMIEIRTLIMRLNRENNMTILISSHILDELAKVATWYGFLDRGRLIEEISADTLREKCTGKIDLEDYFLKKTGVLHDESSS